MYRHATYATLAPAHKTGDGAADVVSLAETWRNGRAERVTRPAREPVLVKAVKFAARRLPTLRRARTAAMQVTAFGFLDYAAWSWHHLFGYVAIGVSLLILEALGGEKRR